MMTSQTGGGGGRGWARPGVTPGHCPGAVAPRDTALGRGDAARPRHMGRGAGQHPRVPGPRGHPGPGDTGPGAAGHQGQADGSHEEEGPESREAPRGHHRPPPVPPSVNGGTPGTPLPHPGAVRPPPEGTQGARPARGGPRGSAAAWPRLLPCDREGGSRDPAPYARDSQEPPRCPASPSSSGGASACGLPGATLQLPKRSQTNEDVSRPTVPQRTDGE